MKKSLTIYFRGHIDRCLANRQIGTARNYTRTLDSFMTFLGRDIPISSLDARLASEYERWLLARGVTRNTVSFYMRNLRSVYNKAVRQGLTIQKNPFADVYTGVDRTRKRAVNEDVIFRLLRLDLSGSYPLALSRDLFIFSYCTRGMSFVDIAFLRRKDVSDGVISYVRRKTGQMMHVFIEPCVESIIKRYSSSGPYLFPLISSLDPSEAYSQYNIALNYHNRKLKILGEMLGTELPLSTYTARHSWATAAQRRNVPLSVISTGMGHASERTTRIYLAGFEDSVIDVANRGIVCEINRFVMNLD